MARKVGRGGMGLEQKEEEEEEFQSSVLHWCGERRAVSRSRKRAREHSISWTIKLLKASDGGRAGTGKKLVNIPRAIRESTRPSALRNRANLRQSAVVSEQQVPPINS